jgi:hypothetical protein
MTYLTSFKIFLLFFFISSCSTLKKERPYANDPVSVATAVDLARAAYLKGCVDARIELEKRNHSYFKCLEASKGHVQDHIIDILEQSGDKSK